MAAGVGAGIAGECQVAAVGGGAAVELRYRTPGIHYAARVDVHHAAGNIDVRSVRLEEPAVVERADAGRGDDLVVQPGEAHLAAGLVIEHRAVVEPDDVVAVGLVQVDEPGVVDSDIVEVDVAVGAAGGHHRRTERNHQPAAADHCRVGAVGVDAHAAVGGHGLAGVDRQGVAGSERIGLVECDVVHQRWAGDLQQGAAAVDDGAVGVSVRAGRGAHVAGERQAAAVGVDPAIQKGDTRAGVDRAAGVVVDQRGG